MSLLTFGPFEFDAGSRRLTRAGEPVAISDRQLGVLAHLLARAGSVVSKDALIAAAWNDVAVTDNSLEQAISALRRLLGEGPGNRPYIETVPRRGYRFAPAVARKARRETDAALDELLAPQRAWIEGRAALETFERDQVTRALDVFEGVLARVPDQASAHVGLANACLMQFEMTRADVEPDAAALAKAARHARDACRLEPEYGEAWATLGVVLARAGDAADGLAASRRAVELEPDNWRHFFRLSSASWGEERLRAARRALALLPGFPLAHWLAATVQVARQALADAERELDAGIAVQDRQAGQPRFAAVALHWLRGLVLLARGEEGLALEAFERELSFESSGHVYARECCANTWYAIGVMRLRQDRTAEAGAAFRSAIERVPTHAMARLGLASLAEPGGPGPGGEAAPAGPGASGEAALLEAARLVLAGEPADAARLVEAFLVAAPPGNAGWLLPVEPILRVGAHRALWASALARLASRAA